MEGLSSGTHSQFFHCRALRTMKECLSLIRSQQATTSTAAFPFAFRHCPFQVSHIRAREALRCRRGGRSRKPIERPDALCRGSTPCRSTKLAGAPALSRTIKVLDLSRVFQKISDAISLSLSTRRCSLRNVSPFHVVAFISSVPISIPPSPLFWMSPRTCPAKSILILSTLLA